MLLSDFTAWESISKGWSNDKKFRVTDADGHAYLLRISPRDKTDRVFAQFQRLKRICKTGIPMCHPVSAGICKDGPYMLLSWIDGVDAEPFIPTLSFRQQYAYGVDAGRILQKIHSIPAPEDAVPWSVRFNQKMDRKIAMYNACPLKYEGGEAFLSHIAKARHLLSDRPQTYQHGDYHIGNMMIGKDGILTVIDFDRDDWGDPWEEFNRIVWCAQASPAFASGMVDGYFDGTVPMEFWELLALYISSNALSSLPWAVDYGEKEIRVMMDQAKEILSWYQNMTNCVPSWYIHP